MLIILEKEKDSFIIAHLTFCPYKLTEWCIILHTFLSIMLSVKATIYKDVVDSVKEN